MPAFKPRFLTSAPPLLSFNLMIPSNYGYSRVRPRHHCPSHTEMKPHNSSLNQVSYYLPFWHSIVLTPTWLPLFTVSPLLSRFIYTLLTSSEKVLYNSVENFENVLIMLQCHCGTRTSYIL